jgi:hypothetical protein
MQADLLGELAEQVLVLGADLALVEGHGQGFAGLVDIGDLNVHDVNSGGYASAKRGRGKSSRPSRSRSVFEGGSGAAPAALS